MLLVDEATHTDFSSALCKRSRYCKRKNNPKNTIQRYCSNGPPAKIAGLAKTQPVRTSHFTNLYQGYSHSVVAGGFGEMSSATRAMPWMASTPALISSMASRGRSLPGSACSEVSAGISSQREEGCESGEGKDGRGSARASKIGGMAAGGIERVSM